MPTHIQPKYVKIVRDRESQCRNCGELDSDNLNVDLILPLSQGGDTKDVNNMQLICAPCNRIKDAASYEFALKDHGCDRMSVSEFLAYKQKCRQQLTKMVQCLKVAEISAIKRSVNMADRAAIKAAIKKSPYRIRIDEVVG